MKLRTTIEVDEDQIIFALRQEVHGRLHGPEFACGDIVRLTDAVTAPGESDADDFDFMAPELRAVLKPGTPAIVASYEPTPGVPKPYALFLIDAIGETARWHASPAQIEARPE